MADDAGVYLDALRSCELPGPPRGRMTLRVLLMVIDAHARNGGWCWPSQETLARQMCCGRNTVSAAVGALRDAGLIETRKGPNNTLAYRINRAAVVASHPNERAESVQPTGTGYPMNGHTESGDCPMNGEPNPNEREQAVQPLDTNPLRTLQEPQCAHAAPEVRQLIRRRLAEIAGLSPSNIAEVRVSDLVRFIRGCSAAGRPAAPWQGEGEVDEDRMANAALDVAAVRLAGETGVGVVLRAVRLAIGAITDAAPAGEYPKVHKPIDFNAKPARVEVGGW